MRRARAIVRAMADAGGMRSEARYDVIVVGAGTAGCLLANRLSADPNLRVLLIEAGGRDDYLWVHIPVGYLYCIGNPRTDWLYRTEPAAGLNGRSLLYPRGKVLGGCSSINGMIYMRGQARDYDGWGRGDGHGPNPGWSWRECLPHFLAHEDHHGGPSAHHAAPGFLRRLGRRDMHEGRHVLAAELERIADEVLHQLPHLQGVGVDAREPPDLDPAARLAHARLEVQQHLCHDGFQVHVRRGRRVCRHARVGEEIVDEQAHPAGGILQPLHVKTPPIAKYRGVLVRQEARKRLHLSERLFQVV